MKMRHGLILGVLLILAGAGFARGQNAPVQPMTDKEVIQELKKQGADQLKKDLSARGTAFDMTPELEKKLRKANASDDVVKAVTDAGPKARAAAKAAALGAGAAELSPDESKDFTALRNELDPDKAISLAEDYAKKYPTSTVLSYVYSFEAGANQQKSGTVDPAEQPKYVAKTVELCQKSLELKKDNLMSLIMAVGVMPQPQYLNQHEADKEKQLSDVQDYAEEALKLIDQLPKQGTETDADFAKRKAEYASGVHAGLGMIDLDRSQLGLQGPDKDELAKAEKEYNTAVTTAEHPDPRDYYRLGEAYNLDGKTEEAIAAFTKAGDLAQGSAIKQYADKQIEALKAKKAGK